MLQDAAAASNAGERGRETPAVLAALVTPPRFDQPGETTPARARRMSDDGQATRVRTSVALLVVPLGDERRVETARIHEESNDVASESHDTASCGHVIRCSDRSMTSAPTWLFAPANTA